MGQTILVVDDETRLVSLIRAYLEQDGFRVVTAYDGKTAIFVAREEKPDLIVLDLMMPVMDGYQFMTAHRKERNTPIILLTAKVEESDRVLGLELGADDYITKPFSPRELVARVKAVLRRLNGGNETISHLLRVGNLTLDVTGHTVHVKEQKIELTPSEFDLLRIFMSSPGRAFSRIELLDQLQQGTILDSYDRVIDVHIKNLRGKIEPNPRQPQYIETVYGVGYRLSPTP